MMKVCARLIAQCIQNSHLSKKHILTSNSCYKCTGACHYTKCETQAEGKTHYQSHYSLPCHLWCEISGMSVISVCAIVYSRGRQPFPSRGPKTNSAKYGGPTAYLRYGRICHIFALGANMSIVSLLGLTECACRVCLYLVSSVSFEFIYFKLIFKKWFVLTFWYNLKQIWAHW